MHEVLSVTVLICVMHEVLLHKPSFPEPWLWTTAATAVAKEGMIMWSLSQLPGRRANQSNMGSDALDCQLSAYLSQLHQQQIA